MLLATVAGAAIGYFTMVGLEIIAFVFGMIWLTQVIQNTVSQAKELDPDAFPTSIA